MSEWPSITMVTISFNQGGFLERAIRSVLDQGYPRLEYIVMDGGSTDGSPEVIRKYADRLAYWQSARDGGAAAALNAGFRRSSGELLGYINSDDEIAPGTLRLMADHFMSHPDCDVAYGDIRYIDAEGRPTTYPGNHVQVFKTVPFNRAYYAYGALVVPQQGSFCRRGVFERVGGFVESNTTCWDGEFFVDAALAGCRFDFLPRVVGDFRMHPRSLSTSGRYRERLMREDEPRIRAKWTSAGFPPSSLRRGLYRGIVSLQRLKRYIFESGRNGAPRKSNDL
jgi:glycosyltransferase involved in cell wall biosynthesis